MASVEAMINAINKLLARRTEPKVQVKRAKASMI